MRIFLLALFDEWCLGLRTISALLKKDGHEVTLAYLRSMSEINDEAGKDDPDGHHAPPASITGADLTALKNLVRKTQPDLIGISLTSNFSGVAEKVTSLLREVTDIPIAWGGVDPTANPDLAITHADIICIGEGDDAGRELAACLSKGQDYSKINNLWVRDGGTVQRNPIRPLVASLDNLPWPDFAPANKFYIHNGQTIPNGIPERSHLQTNFPVLSGRGCPFSCTYCCNSMFRDMYGSKGYIRFRSVENIIAEIEHACRINPSIQYIEFYDDVFGTKQDWLEKFAEVYPKRIGLPFFCFTYPSMCNRTHIAALKRAGCELICMGIQSGSERILREVYNRKGTRQQILRSAHLIHEAGLRLVIDLIGNNPLETEKDYMETLTLLLDFPPGFILNEINPLAIYRNYPIVDIFEKKNITFSWPSHRNVTLAPETEEFRFWNAVLSLTQFKALGRDTIMNIATDTYFRSHPEIVESILHAIIDATYLPGTRNPRKEYEKKLISEIKQLKGSRAVQWYFRIKKNLGWVHLLNPQLLLDHSFDFL